MTDRTLQSIAPPSPLRTGLALFMAAFGFSLLSACLFRTLAFTPASAAFYVLYLCAGMPLGALLSRWKSPPARVSLERSFQALFWLALFFPLLGWLSAHGPDAALDALYRNGGLAGVWRLLSWQTLACAPLFILWGYAEFSGYQVALESPGLQKYFYLIFVWALAGAFAAAYYCIPWLGWLRTVALVPCCAFMASLSWRGLPRAPAKKILGAGAFFAACWMGAGFSEQGFQFLLFSDAPFHARSGELFPMSPSCGAPPLGREAVEESLWGRFCHVSLVRRDDLGGTISGCYDGLFHWMAYPRRNPPRNLESLALSLIPENSRICILGAGGGADVVHALERNPQRVTAVDVAPEIFTLLKEKSPRLNGGIYNHPRVETLCAEGRRFVEGSGPVFDAVVMPHTESMAAAAKALFDPGQRIHTLEGFRAIKQGLRPGGLLILTKTLDRNGALFNGYAASLIQAGFGVSGLHGPAPFGLDGFILLASPDGLPPALPSSLKKAAHERGFALADFSRTPPNAPPITDDSPWISGIMGSAFQARSLENGFLTAVLAGALTVFACLAFSLRGAGRGQGRTFRIFLTLSGIMIGANAVLLENGTIFWFIKNLMNPMAAFAAGTSVFLLTWGFSSLALGNRILTAFAAGTGLLGAAFWGQVQGTSGLVCLGGLALSGGLAFPLLALRRPKDLMRLFIADMAGGILGGLLGVWIPVLMGTGAYFRLLPASWAMTMILVWLALRAEEKIP